MSSFPLYDISETISAAAHTALIDAEFQSNTQFRPKIVFNDYRRGQKVLSTIIDELSTCSAFDFSVAFITKGGIVPLLQVLREAEERNVPGRILTTDYLAFSDPDALEQLSRFHNIDVRMYLADDTSNKIGFHTKGYIFHRNDGSQKILIGSSNLTNTALTTNKEWNVEFTSLEQGELAQQTEREFECMWAAAKSLTSVIDIYREIHKSQKEAARINAKTSRSINFKQASLRPNTMQLEFVASLERLIAEGNTRALLVSATGTGKTYAAAFGLQRLRPKRVLFLAHREQILKQAKESFQRVLGNSFSMGILSGNEKSFDCDYLFTTIQTMTKMQTMERYNPYYFDFIVVDEVHRAGSPSYAKVFDYFRPSFILGMSATPERNDDFDIYGLFHNNIAYEIRLRQAMEFDLLCPFHYFGISDLTVDGKTIDDKTEFNHLISSDRFDYIVQQAQFYGHCGSRVKGLIFCSRREEGVALERGLNERGLATKFISGSDSQEARKNAIARLVSNPGSFEYEQKLDYIITVDIFNEGVDIPEINQILMLRPTQSSIIFIQQLGRGLRKAADKDYVVVVDFIGNYTNNYLIPIALSGNRLYNKDTSRKFLIDGCRDLPGESSVHFDAVARERIFASIDRSTTTVRFLRNNYSTLKNKLGRIPTLVDFYRFGDIDPMLFVQKAKSYYRFLASVEPTLASELNDEEQRILEFSSRYFGNGMRPHELLVLRRLIEQNFCSSTELQKSLTEYSIMDLSEEALSSTVAVLDKTFVNAPGDKESYSDFDLIIFSEDGSFESTGGFRKHLQNPVFKEAFIDLIEFGLLRFKDKYENKTIFSNEYDQFTLYEKYSRKDVCRLLNWPQDNSSTVYGYRVSYGTCPIFVTYNKQENISSSTQYADEFISPYVFSWMTRSRLTLSSPEVQRIINAETTNLDIRLFIKKDDAEGSDFYYFGKVTPVSWSQTKQKDDKGQYLPIVNFQLALQQPVEDGIYAYFEPACQTLHTATA